MRKALVQHAVDGGPSFARPCRVPRFHQKILLYVVKQAVVVIPEKEWGRCEHAGNVFGELSNEIAM